VTNAALAVRVGILVLMKEMSATEVVRHFSAVLDSAENGEAVVITRGGRQVAMLVPAPRANGGALLDVFRRWQGRVPVDDTFAADVAAARLGDPGLDRDPWAD
jgi:prevent-host-death family protein